MSGGKAKALPLVEIVLFASVVGMALGALVAGALGGHDFVVGGLLVTGGALALAFGPELAQAQVALAETGWFPPGLMLEGANNRYLGAVMVWVGLTWMFG